MESLLNLETPMTRVPKSKKIKNPLSEFNVKPISKKIG